jgi:Phage protein Gp138 N-terminal domain
MDRRERAGNAQEAMRAALLGQQAEIWTALPGVLQSFNPTKQTAVVQPSIKARVQRQTGEFEWVTLPLLLDCPVQFPGGGGLVLTLPMAEGDEVLVVFASRCIDSWWQSGGVQVQAELRMHDLSDGFCLPGFSSVPRAIPNVSTTALELRNLARTTRVTLRDTGVIDVVAPTINLTGVVVINGQPYLDHAHTGVVPGPSNTGGVV